MRILTGRLGPNETLNERLMKGPQAPGFKPTRLAGAKGQQTGAKGANGNDKAVFFFSAHKRYAPYQLDNDQSLI